MPSILENLENSEWVERPERILLGTKVKCSEYTGHITEIYGDETMAVVDRNNGRSWNICKNNDGTWFPGLISVRPENLLFFVPQEDIPVSDGLPGTVTPQTSATAIAREECSQQEHWVMLQEAIVMSDLGTGSYSDSKPKDDEKVFGKHLNRRERSERHNIRDIEGVSEDDIKV